MFLSAYILVTLGDVYFCHIDDRLTFKIKHGRYIVVEDMEILARECVGGGDGIRFWYFLVKMMQSGAILRQKGQYIFKCTPL